MSMTTTATVILYTKPGCPGCRMSKIFLERNGIAFESRDVIEDPTALAEVQALGYTALPVIVSGGQHWAGYQPDRLESLAA